MGSLQCRTCEQAWFWHFFMWVFDLPSNNSSFDNCFWMRLPKLSERMGVGEAMERKGGNCGVTLLPAELPMHLKLPDVCSVDCWKTNCQEVVLPHLDSSLLRGRRQCGTSYPLINYFLTSRDNEFWGILYSIADLGDMCLKGLFQSFAVQFFHLYSILCVIIFNILTLSIITNYSSPSCLVLSLSLQHLFFLIPFLSSSG